jgi:hypothetical protein
MSVDGTFSTICTLPKTFLRVHLTLSGSRMEEKLCVLNKLLHMAVLVTVILVLDSCISEVTQS